MMKYEILSEITWLKLKYLSQELIKPVKYNWIFKLIRMVEEKKKVIH